MGVAIPAIVVPNFLESFREIAVAHINNLESRPPLRRDVTETNETNIQRRWANNVLLTPLNAQLAETNGSEMAEDGAHASENGMTPLLSPELLGAL